MNNKRETKEDILWKYKPATVYSSAITFTQEDCYKAMQEFSDQQTKALTDKVAELTESNDNYNEHIGNLLSELSQQKLYEQSLNAENMELIKTIQEQKELVEEKESELIQLGIRGDYYQAECEKLATELTVLKESLEYKDVRMAHLEDLNHQQKVLIENQTGWINNIEVICDSKESSLTTLKQEIDFKKEAISALVEQKAELQQEIEVLKENKSECLKLVESIEKLLSEERDLKKRYENKVESQAKEIEGLKVDLQAEKNLRINVSVMYREKEALAESQSLRIKELEEGMEMYREENYLSVKFKSDLLNKLSDENLATEMLARYIGNSRGNPISKRAFIDCALWIKKFVEAYGLLSTPTTEPKEEKYCLKQGEYCSAVFKKCDECE